MIISDKASADQLDQRTTQMLHYSLVREHEVLNPHLSIHPIHIRILQNCTLFSGFRPYSRALTIAYFAGKCSNLNGF